MNTKNIYILALFALLTFGLNSCASSGSSSGSSSRSVHHYHHGNARPWGSNYYDRDVIIIDDDIDIGTPEAVTLPMDDFDY
jgi:hypothetical protein